MHSFKPMETGRVAKPSLKCVIFMSRNLQDLSAEVEIGVFPGGGQKLKCQFLQHSYIQACALMEIITKSNLTRAEPEGQIWTVIQN